MTEPDEKDSNAEKNEEATDDETIVDLETPEDAASGVKGGVQTMDWHFD